MSILTLQTMALVIPIPFALLALGVARRGAATGPRTEDAWRLAGECFLLIGVVGVGQAAWAILAVRLGAGHPVYARYLDWAAPLNYSRNAALFALAAGLLVWLARRRRLDSPVPPLYGWTAAVMVAALIVGRLDGPLDFSRHFSVLAVMTSVIVILLLGSLLVALSTDAFDQLFWVALVVFAVKEAVSVSLFTILAWRPHLRTLGPDTLYLINLAGWSLMIALAVWRYRLALAFRRVPAPFERLDSPRRTLLS